MIALGKKDRRDKKIFIEVARKRRVDIFAGARGRRGGLTSDEEARLWRVKRSEKWVDFYEWERGEGARRGRSAVITGPLVITGCRLVKLSPLNF